MNKTISGYLLNKVKTDHAPAVSCRGKTLSFEEFFSLIDRFAGCFVNSGVKKGDVVAICLPNTVEALLALYGLNRIGAIADVIHPLSPRAQVDKIIRETGAVMLICLPGAGSDLVPSYTLGDPVKENERHISTFLADVSRDWKPNVRSGPCLYMHSSGTTGEPKTIVLTDDQVNAIADGMAMHYAGQDVSRLRCLAILPIFHGYGFATGMHFFLSTECCLDLVPSYDRLKTPAYAIESKANVLFGVPSIFMSMLASPEFRDADKSHIKQVYVGGDFVSTDLVEKFNACLSQGGSSARLCVGYGLTECVAACASNSNTAYKVGTIGKPFANVEIVIMDEDGNVLPAGERGEICVSGASVMKGYLNDKKATRQALVRGKDGKTWLHTRDVGYYDEDGFLHFLSRIKRIVKVNGFTVFPSEVENVILSIPGVISCVVKEGTVKGYPALIAYVIKDNEALCEEDIMATCAENLIKWSCPKVVKFMDSFPLTATNKVDIDKLN